MASHMYVRAGFVIVLTSKLLASRHFVTSSVAFFTPEEQGCLENTCVLFAAMLRRTNSHSLPELAIFAFTCKR